MQFQARSLTHPPSVLALCLQGLIRDGHAAVAPMDAKADDSDALPWLRQLDELSRQELALDLPEFSAPAALWAARLLQRLCFYTVQRDIGEEEAAKTCHIPCPEARGPETDWSADLLLRHLPRLHELAKRLSNADPLVAQIRQLAAAWPLSSVGLGPLENLRLDSFAGHPALRRLYADRILAAGEASRLGDPRIDDLLRADIGLHQELAPALAAKLFPSTHDTH